mgnify:CR=1 FL=1
MQDKKLSSFHKAMCEHKIFAVEAKVGRLTDESGNVTNYTCDVTVHCAECYKPFEWIGLPGGVNPSFPTTNYDNTTLRAPIKPVI